MCPGQTNLKPHNNFQQQRLTFYFHASSEALGEPTGLAHLLHVLGESTNRTPAVIATLVVSTHLDGPSEEALAGFAADDSVVLPKHGLPARDLTADRTHRPRDRTSLLTTRLPLWWRKTRRGRLWCAVAPLGGGDRLRRTGRNVEEPGRSFLTNERHNESQGCSNEMKNKIERLLHVIRLVIT